MVEVQFTGENSPSWKGGITYDMKAYKKAYNEVYRQTPKYKAYEQTPQRKAYRKKYDAERNARKKAEAQGEGTLDPFLK